MDEILDLPEIHIPEKTLELYKLLAKCNLVDFFEEFADDEINDDSLKLMDPEKQSFWGIVPKILKKSGQLLRFHHELTVYRQNCDAKEKQEGICEPIEEPLFYSNFNKYTVSIFVKNICFSDETAKNMNELQVILEPTGSGSWEHHKIHDLDYVSCCI